MLFIARFCTLVFQMVCVLQTNEREVLRFFGWRHGKGNILVTFHGVAIRGAKT